MPCTAKKGEMLNPLNTHPNIKDVDAVLTVREYAKLLKRYGIKFNELKDSNFDSPLGESSGAGLIFGATGGVMEAALRTAADTLTGQNLTNIEYKKVRGVKGIKEATIKIGDHTLNVCAASGLKNAKHILDLVKNGKKNYHFIEIMACPGGCVNGGGMPLQPLNEVSFTERAKLRAKAIYKGDRAKTIRKSHQNPMIIQLYKEYFEKPGSHKAHDALHRTYTPRKFI
jgi:NADP-reducing hydrogenase subunit HndD